MDRNFLIEPLRTVLELPVQLTDAEKQALGETLARKEGEESVVKAQKSAENKRLGQQIKVLREEIADLSGTINRGTELRDVECETGLDRETGERADDDSDANGDIFK